MHDQGIGLHVPKTEQNINNTRTCAQRNVTQACDLPVLIHLMPYTLAVKNRKNCKSRLQYMMLQVHVLVKRSIQLIWETIALLYAFLSGEKGEG